MACMALLIGDANSMYRPRERKTKEKDYDCAPKIILVASGLYRPALI